MKKPRLCYIIAHRMNYSECIIFNSMGSAADSVNASCFFFQLLIITEKETANRESERERKNLKLSHCGTEVTNQSFFFLYSNLAQGTQNNRESLIRPA